MEDDNTTSFIFENLDTSQKQNQDLLSAEDLAWADSCLITDPEISESNMDSLKEALLDILDQHSAIFNSPSAYEPDNSNDIIAPKNLPSVTNEATSSSHTAETSNNTIINDDLEEEISDVLSALKQQPFLPHFNDEMMNIHYSDDVDFVMEEPLCEDIFKVWDLDIKVDEEENELDKQLNEAFSKKKDLKPDSIDSLIESVADLSLK